MKKILCGLMAVATITALGAYSWVHYQTQLEIEAGASLARKSDALIMQQISMLEDSNTTVGEFFSSSKKASDDLAACVVQVDSTVWKHSPDAREAAKSLCVSSKAAIAVISGSTRLRLDRQSAAERSDKASKAISQSSNGYEIEMLKKQMDEAYDEQIKSLEKEMADFKQNAITVRTLLSADETAVATLHIPGLSQAVKQKLAEMYPEK